MNIELAVELLRSAGATSTIARDGREAVDAFRGDGRFDLILMDCHMPEMDGYDATRAIRALPSGRDIPIIALTASVMENERAHALEVGMNDQVAKPIDVELLYATIERWTRPKPPSAPAPAAAATPTPAASPDAGPVLDQTLGLKYCGGSADLLERARARFAETQRDFGKAFRAAWPSQPKEAERLAHTLKGAGGTIGAVRLSPAAAALESAVRSGQDAAAVATLLAAVEAELRPVVQAIAGAPAAGTPPAGAPPPVPPAQLLAELAAQVARCDAQAGDNARRLHERLRGRPGEEHAARLVQLLRDYDYDGAAQSLAALRPLV